MRGKIDLSWNKITATDEFTIFRRVGTTGTYDEFRTTTGNSFSDTTVVNGRYYAYKIRPKTDCDILSAPACGQTDGFLTSPSSTVSNALGNVQSLCWSGNYLYAVSQGQGLRVYDSRMRPILCCSRPWACRPGASPTRWR